MERREENCKGFGDCTRAAGVVVATTTATTNGRHYRGGKRSNDLIIHSDCCIISSMHLGTTKPWGWEVHRAKI